MIASTQPQFSRGPIVAPPGALEALENAGQTATEFLQRHVPGDWGDGCAADRQANDQSLLDGSRLLSADCTSLGEKLWIITAATADSDHRAATTVLWPSASGRPEARTYFRYVPSRLVVGCHHKQHSRVQPVDAAATLSGWRTSEILA
jgi:hypothetical protein